MAKSDKKQRALFATRIGAIAATVGSAVGLGNIWRFPYEAGQHGGAAFLLIYIGCVLVMGIPVMVAEFIIGRATHKNVCGALREVAPGRRTHWLGYLGIVASIMIISFYSVVCGWIVEYLRLSVVGGLRGHTPAEYADLFGQFVQNPWRSVAWTVAFLLVNHFVLRRGLERGIERIANVLTPVLFVLLLAFCVHSLTLPGAWRGLMFLFSPDFNAVTPRVAIGAMGQAFFSLSLGLSCLLTYASYFKDSDSLVRNASVVALLDTLVAVLAGVMIFPAVFSYGLAPEAGPKLIFEVLPSVFDQMSGGWLWAVLFFVLLFMASVTSTISMSEISIAYFCEERGMSRGRACALSTALAVGLGSLCALSFGPLAGFKVFGLTVFELFDYVSSNVLLPVGGILFSVLVGWVLDKRLVERQLSSGGNGRVRSMRPLVWCLRYVAPALILLVFLYGLGLFGG